MFTFHVTDWQANCDSMSFYEDGLTGCVWKIVAPSPWVFWIAANTGLHILWVGALLVSQLYQVRARKLSKSLLVLLIKGVSFRMVKKNRKNDKQMSTRPKSNTSFHGYRTSGIFVPSVLCFPSSLLHFSTSEYSLRFF